MSADAAPVLSASTARDFADRFALGEHIASVVALAPPVPEPVVAVLLTVGGGRRGT